MAAVTEHDPLLTSARMPRCDAINDLSAAWGFDIVLSSSWRRSRVKRREFIALFSGAAVLPLAVAAQTPPRTPHQRPIVLAQLTLF